MSGGGGRGSGRCRSEWGSGEGAVDGAGVSGGGGRGSGRCRSEWGRGEGQWTVQE